MNIEKAILEKHSKETVLQVVAYIGNDEKKFKELISLYDKEDQRLHQRASWVLMHTVDKRPWLIQPYLEKLLKKLDDKNIHTGLIRNTIRIFEDIDIPESLEGELYDKCMKYLSSMDYPVAVKAFSLTVSSKIALKYPELQNEIHEIIDYQLPHSTAAFKHRAKKVRALFKASKNSEA